MEAKNWVEDHVSNRENQQNDFAIFYLNYENLIKSSCWSILQELGLRGVAADYIDDLQSEAAFCLLKWHQRHNRLVTEPGAPVMVKLHLRHRLLTYCWRNILRHKNAALFSLDNLDRSKAGLLQEAADESSEERVLADKKSVRFTKTVETADWTEKVMSVFTPEEQDIVCRYFGLRGYEPTTITDLPEPTLVGKQQLISAFTRKSRDFLSTGRILPRRFLDKRGPRPPVGKTDRLRMKTILEFLNGRDWTDVRDLLVLLKCRMVRLYLPIQQLQADGTIEIHHCRKIPQHPRRFVRIKEDQSSLSLLNEEIAAFS